MRNKLLYQGQYGFRDNKSTEHDSVEMMDRINSAMDWKTMSIIVFMDLSKDFDSLNHVILLDKLYCYGMRETSLIRLENYFSNTNRYVEIYSF